MPSVWYLSGLHCEPSAPHAPYDEAGAGFPGVPGLVLGHNDRIAWGLTNVGPGRPGRLRGDGRSCRPDALLYKGQSLPFDVRHETVHVSGGADVELDVRSTVHGPVMSDKRTCSSRRPILTGRGGSAWLRLHARLDGDHSSRQTLDAVLGVNRAQNWDEFRTSLSDFGAPSQTFLYADVDGNIGIQVPGLIPIRDSGNGAYIVSGEDGAHDWTGLRAVRRAALFVQPSNGLIVASNNQPGALDSPVFIGREFDPGWRAARIRRLLDPRASWVDKGPGHDRRCARLRVTSR